MPNHLTKNKIKCNKKSGWTLIELVVVIAIVGILFALAVAALGRSKAETTLEGAEANAKVINEAITRAVLRGDTNPIIVGDSANDVEAAAAYLIDEGYIR
jgi:prepilin-type N-terminal cleavage/methylation domain-containing protein